jgi:hypothetical protein
LRLRNRVPDRFSVAAYDLRASAIAVSRPPGAGAWLTPSTQLLSTALPGILALQSARCAVSRRRVDARRRRARGGSFVGARDLPLSLLPLADAAHTLRMRCATGFGRDAARSLRPRRSLPRVAPRLARLDRTALARFDARMLARSRLGIAHAPAGAISNAIASGAPVAASALGARAPLGIADPIARALTAPVFEQPMPAAPALRMFARAHPICAQRALRSMQPGHARAAFSQALVARALGPLPALHVVADTIV